MAQCLFNMLSNSNGKPNVPEIRYTLNWVHSFHSVTNIASGFLVTVIINSDICHQVLVKGLQ